VCSTPGPILCPSSTTAAEIERRRLRAGGHAAGHDDSVGLGHTESVGMRVRGAGANPNFHRAESPPEVARRPRRNNHTTGAVFVGAAGQTDAGNGSP